jgi:hypothetical protein
MVGRFDEGVHLPDLIGRETKAKGWHLGSFAAIDHHFQELFVGQLGGEQIRSARTGAVVTDITFASINFVAGGNCFRLAEDGIDKRFLCMGDRREWDRQRQRKHTGATAFRRPRRQFQAGLDSARAHGFFRLGSIFSMTCEL